MLIYRGPIVTPPISWNRWPVDYVVKACIDITGYTRPEMIGQRTHPVVDARERFIGALREYTTLSYPEIAMILLSGTHSSIHSAYERFLRRRREDREKFLFRVLLECFRLHKGAV